MTNVALSKTLDRGRPGLTVTWAAPQGDKTISQYYVQYKRNEFAFWGSQTVIGGSPPPTCTLLARLAAGTLYDVRVKAVSAAGHGPWSAVQTERTYFDGEFLHYLLFSVTEHLKLWHVCYDRIIRAEL